MGIKSIKCGGYADTKESVFGNGLRTSSDFSGRDILKAGTITLAGIVAAGCVTVDTEPLPKDAKYGYDAAKQEPIGAGKITGERTNGYEMLSANDGLGTGIGRAPKYALVSFANDSAVNFCKVAYRDDAPMEDRLSTYLLTCSLPVGDAGIETGDRVAIYEAYEATQK